MRTAPGIIPEFGFGDRVRKARRLTGLSSAELAKKLGLSPATTAYWESAGTHPKDIVRQAKEIAQLTGVDFYWLLTGDNAEITDYWAFPVPLAA